jgi:hypothetical protein
MSKASKATNINAPSPETPDQAQFSALITDQSVNKIAGPGDFVIYEELANVIPADLDDKLVYVEHIKGGERQHTVRRARLCQDGTLALAMESTDPVFRYRRETYPSKNKEVRVRIVGVVLGTYQHTENAFVCWPEWPGESEFADILSRLVAYYRKPHEGVSNAESADAEQNDKRFASLVDQACNAALAARSAPSLRLLGLLAAASVFYSDHNADIPELTIGAASEIEESNAVGDRVPWVLAHAFARYARERGLLSDLPLSDILDA